MRRRAANAAATMDELGDREVSFEGGRSEFWRHFWCGLVMPLVWLIVVGILKRKDSTKAAVGGAQCGTAITLFVLGVISALVVLFTTTATAPPGVAVVPLILSGFFSPALLHFGTFTYLFIHGQHRRSSLHIILPILACVVTFALAVFVVLYSLFVGFQTAM